MQRDLLQIQLRDNLVRQRVDVVSCVRFTLESLGIRLRSPSTACFARYARKVVADGHPDHLGLVEPPLAVIDSMTGRDMSRPNLSARSPASESCLF